MDHLVDQMLTVPITIDLEKSLLWDPDPGPSSPSRVLVKRKSRKVKMDQGWDPTVGLFSGLIVISTVYICYLSFEIIQTSLPGPS